MLNSTVYYNLFFKDYSMSIATAGATPAASSATTYYLNNIGKVQTIDECMNNTNLYTNAMTGYGLGDMLNEKDLVRQALEQRVSTSKALPNTRRSRNFKALTTALNSQANGSSATNTTAAATGTISKYDEKALDSQIGQQLLTTAISNASVSMNICKIQQPLASSCSALQQL